MQAAAYVNQILNNQNVLGLARELDIIPDFPYYEQVLADYGPLVLSLFQSANSFLLGNLTLDQLRQTLTREIAHLEGLKLALEAELAAAVRGKQVAETEQGFARARRPGHPRPHPGAARGAGKPAHRLGRRPDLWRLRRRRRHRRPGHRRCRRRHAPRLPS